jgi:hypothetical protein
MAAGANTVGSSAEQAGYEGVADAAHQGDQRQVPDLRRAHTATRHANAP